MFRRSIPLVMLLGVTLLTTRPIDVNAQLGDTSTFLAYLSNQYRVTPNVTYHVASNYENRLPQFFLTLVFAMILYNLNIEFRLFGLRAL